MNMHKFWIKREKGEHFYVNSLQNLAPIYSGISNRYNLHMREMFEKTAFLFLVSSVQPLAAQYTLSNKLTNLDNHAFQLIFESHTAFMLLIEPQTGTNHEINSDATTLARLPQNPLSQRR